jgi:hypothetical protein
MVAVGDDVGRYNLGWMDVSDKPEELADGTGEAERVSSEADL